MRQFPEHEISGPGAHYATIVRWEPWRPETAMIRARCAAAALAMLYGCTASRPPAHADGLTCGESDAATAGDSPSTPADVAASDDVGPCTFCKMNGHCKPIVGPPVPGKLCLPTPEGCAHSELCMSNGSCGLLGDDCAWTPVDGGTCADSPACRLVGLCADAADGSCQATSTDDCRASVECRTYGSCSVNLQRHECEPASDADCALSEACSYYGECSLHTAKYNTCRATESSCKASLGCLFSGMCAVNDMWECGGDGVACEKTLGCKIFGTCWSDQSSDLIVCRAGYASDCLQAEVCKKLGACRRVFGRRGCARDADLYLPK